MCHAEAVLEAFMRLHEEGLIYRGSYLVNWSPNMQVRRSRSYAPAARGASGLTCCWVTDYLVLV